MSKRLLLISLIVLAASVAPVAAIGLHTFTDVPDTNVFHDDIDWLADAGVTLGCNPPFNDEFCPTDAVTRQQMAAFLRRLATNQVVDAGALNGLTEDALRTFVVSETDKPFMLLRDDVPVEVLTIDVAPPVDSTAAVTAALTFEYQDDPAVTSGYAVGGAWILLDETNCTGGAGPSVAYSTSIYDEPMAPLFAEPTATVSVVDSAQLSAGPHTISICAGGGIGETEDVILVSVGINVVVAPN